MATRAIGFLLLTLSLAVARVDFSHSQVYDEFDFKGQSKVTLDCSNVCAIFASVTNESIYLANNLLIQLPKGFVSVSDIAARINPITKLKSPLIVNKTATLNIVNGNSQLAAGPLVLYVIHGREAIYPSAEVYEAEGLAIANIPRTLTVMSARPFTLHQAERQGEAAPVPEGIMATMSGFDGLGVGGPTNCWPLYFRSTGSHFSGMSLEVNGPIISVDYDGHDFGVPLPPLTASLGITNKLDLNRAGWVGSPGAHSCEGQPLYRSSLYDMTAPIHAEISTDKLTNFWVKYATSTTAGLRMTDTDIGIETIIHSTTPGRPGELHFLNTQHLAVDWKPEGSGAEYFLVQWNNTSY